MFKIPQKMDFELKVVCIDVYVENVILLLLLLLGQDFLNAIPLPLNILLVLSHGSYSFKY